MAAEPIKLIPHSEIQFVRFSFDYENTPRFSRPFIEHRESSASAPPKVELRPGWNDSNPEDAPPFAASGTDVSYDIPKQKALEAFLNKWVPVPFLLSQQGQDDHGREQLGPTNWARVRVSEAKDKKEGLTHHVVFAFDTEIVKPAPNRSYVAPGPEDVKGEREFSFAADFRNLSWFLSDCRPGPGGSAETNYQEWADRWVDDMFIQFKRAQRGGRELREDDRTPLEHAARYITFIQFLNLVLRPPRVQLIDTYSSEPTLKPVTVDLVLDIGNSRTCGLLIETFPNQQSIDLGNSYILQLRDLGEPHRLYEEPFESDLQLSQASFGDDYLSKMSGRARAFFWPSLVRVGPEAARFREQAEGTEGASGMSSPKRYLFDVEAVNQEWRFQPADYGTRREPPTIDRAARLLMNGRGDVLRQVAEEKKLYERIAANKAELENKASRLTYSRSSFFSFMVAEILVQALSLINNPEIRSRRLEKDTPRRLKRIILSMPTAMPVREQWLLRSRVKGGVKLVWDLMGWTENPPPGVPVPEIVAEWDEASCAQFVYLYGEIAQKFGGNIPEFMRLMGRERPFVEPEKLDAPQGPVQPSLRIASIDVGGGTTDLMITTYYVQQNYALIPCQTFREGFRIAGEDIVREVIQSVLIPGISRALQAAGVSRSDEFLTDRFGSDRANMAQTDKHLRRQYVLRIMKPAALGLLRLYEKSSLDEAQIPVSATIGELAASITGVPMRDDSRIQDYIGKAAAGWGAKDFRMEDVSIPIDFTALNNAIETTLGDVFGNIATAIHHYDCDVVLLSGRPTGLEGTIDLFINKLAISPDRVIPLSHYPPGPWFPFGGSARFPIGDPKTATVVGCMLCALSERHMTNFTMYTNRLAMRSTANYIGVMQLDGKLMERDVLFTNGAGGKSSMQQTASVLWFAPMPIGFRQLPSEKWVATSLYRIKSTGVQALQNIQRPVTIILERELPQEIEEYGSKDFSKSEAMKEELKIESATSNDGATVTRSFSLVLDTLGNDQGYWLDNGILNVY